MAQFDDILLFRFLKDYGVGKKVRKKEDESIGATFPHESVSILVGAFFVFFLAFRISRSNISRTLDIVGGRWDKRGSVGANEKERDELREKQDERKGRKEKK